MGFKAFFTAKTSGVLESANFQVVNFGDISESAMNAIITSASGGAVTTIAGFNALQNELKAKYVAGFFSSPTYVKSLTLNGTLSLKTSGAALGSDSAVITEVTGSDGSQQTVAFLNTNELAYGYIMFRGLSGASGYLASKYIYSDIFLHDAGYGFDQIKALTGAAGVFSGSSNSNISTAPQADTTNFSAWSITTKHVFDGVEKIGNATNGNRFKLVPVSGSTITATTIKSLNYIAMVWSNINNTIPLRFFNNDGVVSECGIQVEKDGSYWKISSPTLAWFTSVTFNGSGGVPEVLYTQTAMLEIIITDTYVKVRWNGDTTKEYNLTKSGVGTLTRSTFDTQIGSTARRPMDIDHGTVIGNTFAALFFFTTHPGTSSTTTPDALISQKIRTFLKRIALKNDSA